MTNDRKAQIEKLALQQHKIDIMAFENDIDAIEVCEREPKHLTKEEKSIRTKTLNLNKKIELLTVEEEEFFLDACVC